MTLKLEFFHPLVNNAEEALLALMRPPFLALKSAAMVPFSPLTLLLSFKEYFHSYTGLLPLRAVGIMAITQMQCSIDDVRNDDL